ncbi:MAG: hypothetical protein E7646_05625 [Ruminococcaceae bacterium]|nr:hypothetical protein [Oscillospiraceae bacterium]
MKEKTKRIIATIAAEQGITPEEAEHQICPDGKEPDLDTFFSFVANRVDMMTQQQEPRQKNTPFRSRANHSAADFCSFLAKKFGKYFKTSCIVLGIVL